MYQICKKKEKKTQHHQFVHSKLNQFITNIKVNVKRVEGRSLRIRTSVKETPGPSSWSGGPSLSGVSPDHPTCPPLRSLIPGKEQPPVIIITKPGRATVCQK